MLTFRLFFHESYQTSVLNMHHLTKGHVNRCPRSIG